MIHVLSDNTCQENICGLYVDNSREVSMTQSPPVLPQRPKLIKQSTTSSSDDYEVLLPVTNSAASASRSSSATAAVVSGDFYTYALCIKESSICRRHMNRSLHTAEAVFTFAILQFSTDLLRLFVIYLESSFISFQSSSSEAKTKTRCTQYYVLASDNNNNNTYSSRNYGLHV